MSPRLFPHASLSSAISPIFCVLALSPTFLVAQATVSAGTIALYEVKTIYLDPSSGDFAQLLKSELDRSGIVNVTAQIDEADAILTCATESKILATKMVVRVIEARAQLVDRHTKRIIWSTRKSTSWNRALASEIVSQFKKDRERSIRKY